ncbi:hypothetical protein E4T56_gene10196 [Termitomyces sp. T112]|nr:hypothetical protein E4T56_gene10196 [Termitomyces sp. T112]KAH0578431.1 hypothetical protein H2248_003579 [Termitomyces sp. 'cryptogamus']
MGGNTTFNTPDTPLEARAAFFGTYLAVLAYGALLMLYVQLTGVLIARPGRGMTFWLVLAYSVALSPLATATIGTIFKFSVEAFVESPLRTIKGGAFEGGPFRFYKKNSSNYVDVLGEVSATSFGWLADILMLVRLWVIWKSSWLMMAVPLLLYITRVAVSIPMMIVIARKTEPAWTFDISTSYHSLMLAFNLYMTCMICLRLHMLRPRLQAVSGKLHASFYTSVITTFVESAGFFTMWQTIFLILRSRKSPIQWAFFFSIPFILGVTRMLIILRLAQDRAWSRDLVESIHHGVLDWQVSSTQSIPLHGAPSISDFTPQNHINKVPKKIQGNFYGLRG